MAANRDWKQIVEEYNTSIDRYEMSSDPAPSENNLRVCPKCNKVYEHRYEQLDKTIVCFYYESLFTWAVVGMDEKRENHKRYIECNSSACCGEMKYYDH